MSNAINMVNKFNLFDFILFIIVSNVYMAFQCTCDTCVYCICTNNRHTEVRYKLQHSSKSKSDNFSYKVLSEKHTKTSKFSFPEKF